MLKKVNRKFILFFLLLGILSSFKVYRDSKYIVGNMPYPQHVDEYHVLINAINMINNQNFYEPIKVYNKTLKSNKIKPGFLEQYLAFSKFIDNSKILNDIKFAEKIQKLIFEILK